MQNGALHNGALRAFLRDERAAATIEFVLWVPVIVFILLAAVDATILYLHHTEMWNVARDVARRVSVGEITEDDAVDAIKEGLYLRSDSYFVQTSDPKSIDVQIYIQTPVIEASVFGIFQPILGNQIHAYVRTRREPI